MIVRVLGAFIAIFTFAVLQETPKKYLGCAGIVGAVGWLAYLLSEHAGADTVLATFISAMTITLISHTFARIFKAPVTVFLIAGILPTVPGSRHVSDCILHYSGRSCDVQLLSDKYAGTCRSDCDCNLYYGHVVSSFSERMETKFFEI